MGGEKTVYSPLKRKSLNGTNFLEMKFNTLSSVRVVSLFSLVIAGFAAYFSYKSNVISEQNRLISEEALSNSIHPNWQHNLVFADNNHELVAVNFHSPNESINIQSIDVLVPTPNSSGKVYKKHFYENEWKTIQLLSIMNNVIEEEYGFIEKGSFDRFQGFDECYPVSVTINYSHFGQNHSSNNIYLLHFTVFPRPPIVFRNLEYREEIELEEVQLEEFLNHLACTTCIQNLECIDEQDLIELGHENSKYQDHMRLALKALQTIVVQLESADATVDTTNQNNFIHVPPYLISEDSLLLYINLLKDIKSNEKITTSEKVKKYIQEISQILETNELCSLEKYNCYEEQLNSINSPQVKIKNLSTLLMLELIVQDKKDKWNLSESKK